MGGVAAKDLPFNKGFTKHMMQDRVAAARGLNPKTGDAQLFQQYKDAQSAKKVETKKVGIAKVRKEPLKNIPDKKIIHRGKDYRSRITSRVQTSGVTKRPQASRPNLGSRVAALLKPEKDKKKDEDKLG